jgi:hypothetical protein
MAKTYKVDISDIDWACLAWKHVDPNQHIDDLVTNRAEIGIKELAESQIRHWQQDPNYTDPIPADYSVILANMEIKTAKQIQEESHSKMQAMMANPDVVYEWENRAPPEDRDYKGPPGSNI